MLFDSKMVVRALVLGAAVWLYAGCSSSVPARPTGVGGIGGMMGGIAGSVSMGGIGGTLATATGGGPAIDESTAGTGGATTGGAGTAGAATGGAAMGGAGTGGAAVASSGDGGGFMLTSASTECGTTGAASPASTAPAAGLNLPPSSGHHCDAVYEPNDTPGEACQLALGDAVETQLAQPNDVADNFVFHAEARVYYTLMLSALNCTGSPGSNSVHVTANSLAPNGQTPQLNSNVYFGDQGAFEIQSNTTADELVTLTSSQSCQYNFKVIQSSVEGLKHNAEYEPNDTPSTAAVFDVASIVSASLSGPADRIDYYSVPVNANTTYSIRVSAQKCSGAPGGNNIAVVGWSLGTGDPVQNLPQSFAYFGTVYDGEFTSTTSGDERISLSTTQSCQYQLYVIPSTVCGLAHGADYEPNDTPGVAADILLGQTFFAQVQQPEDSSDYYTFPVEPKTTYTLSVSAENCVGSPGGNYLSTSLWSGRTKQLPNGSSTFYFGAAKMTYPFVTGSSAQELLMIQSTQSCAYQFGVSKN